MKYIKKYVTDLYCQ